MSHSVRLDRTTVHEAMNGIPRSVYRRERGRDLGLQHLQPTVRRAYDALLSFAFRYLEFLIHPAAKPPDLFEFGCRYSKELQQFGFAHELVWNSDPDRSDEERCEAGHEVSLPITPGIQRATWRARSLIKLSLLRRSYDSAHARGDLVDSLIAVRSWNATRKSRKFTYIFASFPSAWLGR
jgi:hypothetical protein